MLLNWNRKSNVRRLLWLKNLTQKQMFSVMTFLKNIISFTWTDHTHLRFALVFFKRTQTCVCLGFSVTLSLAGCYNSSPTWMLWSFVCRRPAKKSARPTTSSCAPSVTSTAPTWDCQTAASTPRYMKRGTKCSQQLILVIVADLSVS